VVQVQQDGVDQVFFTLSLTSESAGPWKARSKPLPDFRLPCNLARCFIRYLRRCQWSPLPKAAHSIRFAYRPRWLFLRYSGGCACVPSTGDLPTRRLPPARLAEAAFAGPQDSAPQSAVLALHAHEADVSPSAWKNARFVQVWGPRGALFLVTDHDYGRLHVGPVHAQSRSGSGREARSRKGESCVSCPSGSAGSSPVRSSSQGERPRVESRIDDGAVRTAGDRRHPDGHLFCLVHTRGE
jgi:hypothetical protein